MEDGESRRSTTGRGMGLWGTWRKSIENSDKLSQGNASAAVFWLPAIWVAENSK